MRIDLALVARRLATSRSRAQELIKRGKVLCNTLIVQKASHEVREEDYLQIIDDELSQWVSRSALKLVQALEFFSLDPSGVVALDVGASTGGFTQVLRLAGARKVYALDVGHGQLHPRVAADPDVVNLEGINIKNLPDGLIAETIDWIVSDVSFISLDKALPRAFKLASPQAILIALIKPQFEVGPGHVDKKGIIRDPGLHQKAIDRVSDFLRKNQWQIRGICTSTLLGGDGNQEFLIAAQRQGEDMSGVEAGS